MVGFNSCSMNSTIGTAYLIMPMHQLLIVRPRRVQNVLVRINLAYFLDNIFAAEIAFVVFFSPLLFKTLVPDLKTTRFRDAKPFPMVDPQEATRHLRQNKCADSNGIVAQCFVYGVFELLEHLVRSLSLMCH